MSNKYKFGNLEFEAEGPVLKQPRKFLSILVSIFLIYSSIYTVDANENAVILRLGKYHTTTTWDSNLNYLLLIQFIKLKLIISIRKNLVLEL